MTPLGLLYSALHSPFGLLVITRGGYEKAKRALYDARKESGDARLGVLELRNSGLEGGDLLVVKVAPRGQEELK